MQMEEKAAKTGFGKVGRRAEYGVRKWSKVVQNANGKCTLELGFMWSKYFSSKWCHLKEGHRTKNLGDGVCNIHFKDYGG